MKANPAPRATIADAADHIDHIKKVAGIDHIGLGGDFDGITSVVQGLEDVSTYPALTAELLRRGYQDDEIKKILGLNLLRVMRKAEAVSAAAAEDARRVADAVYQVIAVFTVTTAPHDAREDHDDHEDDLVCFTSWAS